MSKKIIICVDDEQALLRSLKEEILSIFGYAYQIEIVDNPNDALELLSELQKDNYEVPLIISDYIMPEMYGDKMLQKVHKISSRTITVMLSGQATLDGVVNAINEAQLFKYLEKPWGRKELENMIVDAIRLYDENKASETDAQLISSQNDISENELQTFKEKIDFLKEICEPLPDIRADINKLFEEMPDEEKEKILYTKSITNIEKILHTISQKGKDIHKEGKL